MAGFKAAFGPGLARVPASTVLGGRALYNEIPASSGGGAGHGYAAARRDSAAKPPVGIAGGVAAATGGLLRGLVLGSGDAAVKAAPARVGNLTPVEDFRALLLSADGDSAAIAAAAHQLAGAVKTLAADPFTVDRALELIHEYRRQAVQSLAELVPPFNAFLRELRASHGSDAAPPHGSPLWQRLLCTSTSIISVLECPRAPEPGAASASDQAAFFTASVAGRAGGASAAAPAPTEDDELGLE